MTKVGKTSRKLQSTFSIRGIVWILIRGHANNEIIAISTEVRWNALYIPEHKEIVAAALIDLSMATRFHGDDGDESISGEAGTRL